MAFQKERQLQKRDYNVEVFYPIAVDNYVFSHHCRYHHEADLIVKQIGNFKNWKDYDSYQNVFQLLVKALTKKAD